MRVLLSIKPEYAFKIFDGTKKFEFRKVIFKNPDITTVVVYASSPVQQVIGEFEIDDIFSFDPDELWKKTKKYSGISEEKYFAPPKAPKFHTPKPARASMDWGDLDDDFKELESFGDF